MTKTTGQPLRPLTELSSKTWTKTQLGLGLLAWVWLSSTAIAQPIIPAPDGTGTVVHQEGETFNITGGQLSGDGSNLFHSFTEFGLDTNQIGNFQSNPAIVNILGRINGGNPSIINGLIQVTGGNSNLFLMNPAGILFGPNASLNLPASFTVTTGTGIGFGNSWFDAIAPNDYAALVGTPSAFAFTTSQPGSLVNFGNLFLQQGDLTLLGGTVLNIGTLSAPGGNVTIAAVPGESSVRISQENHLLSLEITPSTAQPLNPSPNAPHSLPQLLTGGGASNATHVRVNADGTVQLTGSGLSVEAGDVAIASPNSHVNAASATISADRHLTVAETQLQTTGDLNLFAADTVQIRDSQTTPVILQAGERLYLQGNQNVDIFALNHPTSALISGGDMILRSLDTVGGDAHYFTGGNFAIERLDGSVGNLFSPYDPIVLADGDVSIGDYTGASLHILAGGSVTLGSVTITGTDTENNSINPNNTTPVNATITIADLATVTLSNGTPIPVDGSAQPTLDVRAGVDWAQLGGVPGNRIIPTRFEDPIFAAPTNANITVNGNIDVNDGLVLLTNQYQPNGLAGTIVTQTIKAGVFSGTTPRQIAIDSRSDIAIDGNVNAFNTVVEDTPANGGDIILLADTGIAIAGGINSYSEVSLGTVGNGGDITAMARNGNIEVNTSVFGEGINASSSSVDGNGPGRGGKITLTASDNISIIGPVDASSEGDVGSADGGNISLTATTGGIDLLDFTLPGGVSSFSHTNEGNSGAGGKIELTAETDILVEGSIDASTESSTGDAGVGGQIDVTSNSGSITVNDDISALSLSFDGNASSGGAIDLNAVNDIVIGNNVVSSSLTLGVGTTAGNGGEIALRSTNGNISVQNVGSASFANGGTSGNGGEIILDSGDRLDVFDVDATSSTGVGGNISLTGDEIDLNSVEGERVASNGGTLTLQPATASQAIAIAGTDNNTAALDLTSDELNRIEDGFVSITIGRADGSGAVTIDPAGVTFSDPVTVQSPLGTIAVNGEILGIDDASITLNASTVTLSGNITTSNQPIQIGDRVQLGADATLDTAGVDTGNIIINGEIDGTFGLTLNAGTSNVQLNGAIGSTTPLGSLDVTAGNTDLGGNITTDNGNVTFDSLVNLNSANAIAAGTGTIAFNNTVAAGTNNLTLTAGEIDLSGGVNSFTGTGAIALQPGTATGDVAIGTTDNTTAALDLTSEDLAALQNGFSSITIGRADGSGTMTIAPTGSSFADPLTIQSPSGAIAVTGTLAGTDNASVTLTGNTIDLGGNITTENGAIAATGNITVSSDSTLDTTTAGSNITLDGTVDGAASLTVDAGTGNASISGAIGVTTPLTNFTVNGNTIQLANIGDRNPGAIGTTTITAANAIDLTGNTYHANGQTYTAGNLNFNASEAIAFTASDGDVTFNLDAIALSDGSDLTVNTNNGNITLPTLIGSAGENLTLNAGSGNISVGAVSAIGIVSANSSGITNFESINATAVQTDAGGSTQLNGNITTASTNGQTYGDAVELNAVVSLTSNNANINFNSTLDGTHDLAIAAGSGNLTFSNTVGGTQSLGNMTVDSAATLSAASINAASFRQVAGSGTTTLGVVNTTGANGINVTTTSNITTQDITTNGGAIALNSSNGSIDTGNLNTSSSNNGGDVNLTAQTYVNTGTIDTTSSTGSGGDASISTVNNITTGDIQTSSGVAGGNITLNSTGSTGSVYTGDLLSLGETGNGGSLFINAAIDIITGAIDTSSVGGNAGNVKIDPENILVQSIRSESTSGSGGTIDIVTSQNFRATGTFTARDGTVASISSQGGAGHGSITIRHGGNGVIPFVVGDASTNGTAGAITTGADTIANDSFLYTVQVGDIGIISVPEPPEPEPETPAETPTEPETPAETPTEPETPIETPTEPETPAETPTEPETPIETLTEPQVQPPAIAPAPDIEPFPVAPTEIPEAPEAEAALPTIDPVLGTELPLTPIAETNVTEPIAEVPVDTPSDNTPDAVESAVDIAPAEIAPAIATPVETAPEITVTESNPEAIAPVVEPSPTQQAFGVTPEQQTQILTTLEGEARKVPAPPQSSDRVIIDPGMEAIDEKFTRSIEQYFGKPENTPTKTLNDARHVLHDIERETGVKPALIYVNFVPSTLNDSRENDELELVLVTAEGEPTRSRIAVPRKEAIAVVNQFGAELLNPIRRRSTRYLKQAQQLYQWIIAPLETTLQAQKIENLVFIMDTGLRSLPIAALHDGNSFLIERYSVGLMPSLSLTDTVHVDLKNLEILAMGASEFTELNPLPAVPVELKAIAGSLWPGEYFLNESFTLNNLKTTRDRRRYGIVHLSTHGEFKAGDPSKSYIQLWDNKLTLDRIRELGLNDPPVELLVLSACRTAIGDKEAELGFAGLAYQAGVKSAIASLWYVSDTGTLALMREFYSQLRSAPIKAEALRQAQLSMLRGKVRIENGNLVNAREPLNLPEILANQGSHDLTHPYYWAAFTTIGNPW